VQRFDGDLEDYRRALLNRRTDSSPAGAATGGNARRAERQRQADLRARLAPLRQEAKAAERELERLTHERARLAATLADGATYRLPGDELEELLKRQAALGAAIETAEHRWLEAAEALEEASSEV
jgi:ATP-binding cassette subfamily F protein 3